MIFCFSVRSQKEFMKQNTPRQTKNCLQNFDLSEHRQILSDLAIHIYHQFIDVMEKDLTPAIGIFHSLLVPYTDFLWLTIIFIFSYYLSSCASSLAWPTVPGMLEHESLQGISSMKPSGFRKRSNSVYDDLETYTISSIIQKLSVFHATMTQHGMEQGLIKQVAKQLFFLVGATTLNNMMLRKDMCSCRKGMQIRSGFVFVLY